MALHGYKPGELFSENYADRAAKPSRNEGNSLAARIEHSPVDVIVLLIGKILNQNFKMKLVSSTSANSYSCKTIYFLLRGSCDLNTHFVREFYNTT